MDNINSVKPLLDRQDQIAIWYTEYEGDDETVLYTNKTFSETFGLSIEQILERKKYCLINPPETAVEVIEQYRKEDFEAIKTGCFVQSSPLEAGQQIVVVKLRFDQGMLGLFKIVDSEMASSQFTLQNLDADFQKLLKQLQPDLI